ncbi:riboflavin biosynthesis protein RibF [Thalassobacillus pellis]|uniref:riboflavin biosynthesis protein RibF n=1 Tax=Thalassobacillus pellis TaxID=748008 RepID=UPI0019620836|nr:riboflavin biosynthesis protein RibF [Thalassobacillus pellis]MBM7552704.1 riboflavin kinase/FMN adenylyltransferase [Thalassobacillus pellis]
MQVTELEYPHSYSKEDFPSTVVAAGFFDGVHKGHQKLIETAVALAEQKQQQSAVMTFYPHPSVVLKKDVQHVQYITPLPEKIKIFESLGVDQLFIVTFNEQLAELLPQEFVDHFFIGLNVRHVIAGFDFSYGRLGRGNMETLPFHSRGEFEQTIIEKVETEGEKISSTRIRKDMEEGNMQEVTRLLGRPHSMSGIVVKGDQRGHTIGFPTANIEVSSDYLLPRIGVYAVTVRVKGGEFYGMANLGYKPTFQEDAIRPNIEVNIFDFEGDIYGEPIEVNWYTFIRQEVKFNGIDELVSRLKQDEREIRRFFSI